MLFQNIAAVSALAVTVGATVFSYGTPPVSYEFTLQGSDTPETTDIKNSYEQAAAQQAYARITSSTSGTDLETTCPCTDVQGKDARNATYALKDCVIGASNDTVFLSLLSSDTTAADAFWGTVVSQSSSNMSDWKASRAYAKAYFGASLTAVGFAGWSISSAADAANLHANPEHYYKSTPTNATGTSSEILEGWGGVLSSFGMKRTHFKIPEYAQPAFDGTDYPASWSVGPDFLLPLQRAGKKNLASDGTTFGVLHIAVRDLGLNETLNGVGGIEIYSAVWYPAWEQASEADAAEFDKYLRDEAEHMVVEVVNLTQKARDDLALV